MASISFLSRVRGSLLGVALGDAVGARYEGMTADYIQRQVPSLESLAQAPDRELWYTDDTQMTIGVAEVLVSQGNVSMDALYRQFVANYDPQRGYGRGARHVLEAGELRYAEVAASVFPGGSYGNGAAMRVAPIGVCLHQDDDLLWDQAMQSALPTHVHPIGIEGAQLLALAIAWATRTETFDREALFGLLLSRAQHEVYRRKLEVARTMVDPSDLDLLGNGIEAQESVITAIASFALAPDDYLTAVGRLILLGGDTDTLAAMAGGLSGAWVGEDGLPHTWLNHLEQTPQGKSYLYQLADRLAATFDPA